MSKKVKILNRTIGENESCFVIAEIGINHNGSLSLAKRMIDEAVLAGCDAVKFQKRTVDVVYTQKELAAERPNFYGPTNGDLKRGLELNFDDYCEIDDYCKSKKIMWFASCWDKGSVDFIDRFNPPCYKISSASLTDDELLRHTKSKGKPILLSTGMSTLEEISHAVDVLGEDDLILFHCTSTYPTNNDEINIKAITQLKELYECPIAYSGHERGYLASVLAVVMGAASVERHITIDRTLWGSDQAASLESEGLRRMVRDIRNVPFILGNGEKTVYESEKPIIKKLRKAPIEQHA